ncbi:hypothetical protein TNCV_3163781, partial [Trichonephila clavipes]
MLDYCFFLCSTLLSLFSATKSCGRPGTEWKLKRVFGWVFTIGMGWTQRTAPWENWHLEWGFELLRTFGLV